MRTTSLTHCPWGIWQQSQISKFQTHFNDKYLKYFLWNCYQVNATIPHWSLVNIGSGNGLVPSPYDVIRPQWVKYIFMYGNWWILIKISLKFVLLGTGSGKWLSTKHRSSWDDLAYWHIYAWLSLNEWNGIWSYYSVICTLRSLCKSCILNSTLTLRKMSI